MAARSIHERTLLQAIDHDGPFGNTEQYPMAINDSDIVVEASSLDFDPVRLRIPTSTNPSTASVLAVAKAGAGKPVNFFTGSTPEDISFSEYS